MPIGSVSDPILVSKRWQPDHEAPRGYGENSETDDDDGVDSGVPVVIVEREVEKTPKKKPVSGTSTSSNGTRKSRGKTK